MYTGEQPFAGDLPATVIYKVTSGRQCPLELPAEAPQGFKVGGAVAGLPGLGRERAQAGRSGRPPAPVLASLVRHVLSPPPSDWGIPGGFIAWLCSPGAEVGCRILAAMPCPMLWLYVQDLFERCVAYDRAQRPTFHQVRSARCHCSGDGRVCMPTMPGRRHSRRSLAQRTGCCAWASALPAPPHAFRSCPCWCPWWRKQRQRRRCSWARPPGARLGTVPLRPRPGDRGSDSVPAADSFVQGSYMQVLAGSQQQLASALDMRKRYARLFCVICHVVMWL